MCSKARDTAVEAARRADEMNVLFRPLLRLISTGHWSAPVASTSSAGKMSGSQNHPGLSRAGEREQPFPHMEVSYECYK